MKNIESEFDIRSLRDKVFDVPTTDKNWEACKAHWMRLDSIAWLKSKESISLRAQEILEGKK